MIWPFFYVSLKIKYVLPLKSEHRSYAAITCLLPSNEMCVVNGPKCPIISHGVSKFLLVESDYPPPQLHSLPYGPCQMNQNPQVHHAGRMVRAYETLFQVVWSRGEVWSLKSKWQRFQVFNVCSFAHLVPQVTGEKYMRERGGVEESCSLVGMLWRCCLQHLAAGVLLAATNSNMHLLVFRVGSFEGPKKPLNSSQLPGPPNYCKMVELMQGLKSDADQK